MTQLGRTREHTPSTTSTVRMPVTPSTPAEKADSLQKSRQSASIAAAPVKAAPKQRFLPTRRRIDREINKLIGKVERAGYALIPLDMHFSRGRVKLTVALAKGKREYEKRADESKKQWQRDRERLMKKASK